MRWFIIAAAISVAAGIFSLIKSLTNNRKKGTESHTVTPQLEQNKSKASYGKMWNWIIPIGIISALVLGLWIAPKYFNKEGEKSLKVYAIHWWEKEPHQYGENPEMRSSYPMEATVMQNYDGVFIFKSFYTHKGRSEFSLFQGEFDEEIHKGTRIKGFWNQDQPVNGGKWYLECISEDCREFKGKLVGKAGEWIPMFLKIKKS